MTKKKTASRAGSAVAKGAWRLARVLAATGGRLLYGDQTTGFAGVCTDSRAIAPGELFVALRGENFDGHAYLAQAVEKGAAGLVVETEPAAKFTVPVVQVADTLRALGDLAAYRRRLFPKLKVVGITGSCGKTTVKEMVAAIFSIRHKIIKTEGNFNNLIGLPLSLLPVTAAHEFAILEMGMNRPGEIARLTEIAAPDIACINNVHGAHLAGFGDISGVVAAKGELFATAGAAATLVVNSDDRRVAKLAKSCPQKKITYGRASGAMVRGLYPRSCGQEGMAFTLKIGDHEARYLKIRGLGVHNVQNALAAAAIAWAAGLDFAEITAGLAAFVPYEKRLQVQELAGGVKLLNDAYNANPASMLAALETLQGMGGEQRKVVILGDMLELGLQAKAAHETLGRQVAAFAFDTLLTAGEFADTVAGAARKAGMAKNKARSFADKTEISDWLRREIASGALASGDWVLLKGSRGMRMETITNGLLAGQD